MMKELCNNKKKGDEKDGGQESAVSRRERLMGISS